MLVLGEQYRDELEASIEELRRGVKQSNLLDLPQVQERTLGRDGTVAALDLVGVADGRLRVWKLPTDRRFIDSLELTDGCPQRDAPQNARLEEFLRWGFLGRARGKAKTLARGMDEDDPDPEADEDE